MALAVRGPVIDIPAPLAHQDPIVESAARFKVVRAGRRGGKTVLAEGCAVVGHGPIEPDGEPLFKGIVHDLDVVWVARDYTQAGIVWGEFFRPRFKGVPGVKVNETERTVTIKGFGTIFLVSAENIASVRGIGKRLAGVIVEEAAWLDLKSALRDVLLPALMDNEGWLLIISTTNAGCDGGKDEAGQPQVPSYFNTICEEIQSGKRSAEWEEFYFTAEDNPKISKRAFVSLLEEYTPGTPSLEQEVYARLLKGGVGVALPLLSIARHLVPRFAIPEDCRQFGGFDWGFNHPWSFGWYAVDDDGQVICVDTVWGRQQEPEQIATTIAAVIPVDRLRTVYAGPDIFQKKGRAIGYKGRTIDQELRVHGIRCVRANTDRVLGLSNLRRFIYWEADETGKLIREPQLTFMDTPGNRRLLTQCASMQIDPDNIEDALKVDADSQGRGGDDGYDQIRYGMMSRYRPIKKKEYGTVDTDQAEHFDYKRRKFVEYEHALDEIVSSNRGRRTPAISTPRLSTRRAS